MKAIYLMLFLHLNLYLKSQNVGIGTSIPSAPLHIKSSSPEILRLDGVYPYISFFHAGNYKGYLWHDGTRMELGSSTNEPVVISANYNSNPAFFTPNGRLGLGISNPTERLDVNGSINLNGLIKVNGNAGTPGQILTSNGASNPTWSSAALSNNIRFSVLFGEGSSTSGYATILSTHYNLNPAEVGISSSGISILRSGLYHFDIEVGTNIGVGSAPTITPYFLVSLYHGLPSPIRVIPYTNMTSSVTSNTSWRGASTVSIDVYISAPASVTLSYLLGGPSGITSFDFLAWVTGHLVSE